LDWGFGISLACKGILESALLLGVGFIFGLAMVSAGNAWEFGSYIVVVVFPLPLGGDNGTSTMPISFQLISGS
jgi:hypothetical protein